MTTLIFLHRSNIFVYEHLTVFLWIIRFMLNYHQKNEKAVLSGMDYMHVLHRRHVCVHCLKSKFNCFVDSNSSVISYPKVTLMCIKGNEFDELSLKSVSRWTRK